MSSESERRLGIEKLGQPPNSHIRYVIAVMSGKGGVGKSSVAALTASGLSRCGKRVGVLDADITGPSIPKLFGVTGSPDAVENKLLPLFVPSGVSVMSINLILENPEDPVIWRGPLIGGAVKQFWSDVIWGDLDYLIVDLPPGTGDAPLTVLQSLPVDDIIVVSSPAELTVLVVKKAVNMARMLNVPILGLVENMAWIECPKCGERIEPFGHSNAEKVAGELEIPLLGSLRLDPRIAELGDAGRIEEYQSKQVDSIVAKVKEALHA